MNVNYERRGSGTPLVLVHGIGHRWQAWEPVLDRLAERHDVIAIDLPGFGKSPGRPDAYTAAGAVTALAEFFAELGLDRPHVAGNSLGGMLALELASAGHVRSATALSPAGFWASMRGQAWALNVLRMIRSTGKLSERAQTLVLNTKPLRLASGSLLFGRPSRVPVQAMLDDMLAMAAATGFDPVARAGKGYYFASPAPSVPVTVAWGTRDRILWPSQSKRAALLLPAARHVPLPKCGHVPMHDDPELITRTILETTALAVAREAA